MTFHTHFHAMENATGLASSGTGPVVSWVTTGGYVDSAAKTSITKPTVAHHKRMPDLRTDESG